MNVKQKTLAALLVLGIGMSGCNNNDNNLPSQIVNKNTDENKTEGNRTVPTSPGENNESNGTVPTSPGENNESNGTVPGIVPTPPVENNNTDNNDTDNNDTETIIPIPIVGSSEAMLKEIAFQHSDHNSTITVVQLHEITPALENINDNYQDSYRSYIASADNSFSLPATRDEVQHMIDEVNALKHATTQTEEERSDNVLKKLFEARKNLKSTVTIEELKAIINDRNTLHPGTKLTGINDDYQDIYRSYIVSHGFTGSNKADTSEVQKMITDINNFIDTHAQDPILAEIATQHSNGSSTVTSRELYNISIIKSSVKINKLPYYKNYIENADTHFSFPATVVEVQRMIDEVNSFHLPDDAVLDKNFFKKTRGKFEHRFVYLPVTNPTTGKTWLNNYLGAWTANVGKSMYNPAQQARNANDLYAKGSLFQWGRKADGHEIVSWWYSNGAIDPLATTTTKSDNPTDGKFVAVGDDWRVHPDDNLWTGVYAPNNPCPAHYRVPTKEELDIDAQTWDSLIDGVGVKKIPAQGRLSMNGSSIYNSNGLIQLWNTTPGVAWTPNGTRSLRRTNGLPIRCIKN